MVRGLESWQETPALESAVVTLEVIASVLELHEVWLAFDGSGIPSVEHVLRRTNRIASAVEMYVEPPAEWNRLPWVRCWIADNSETINVPYSRCDRLPPPLTRTNGCNTRTLQRRRTSSRSPLHPPTVPFSTILAGRLRHPAAQ